MPLIRGRRPSLSARLLVCAATLAAISPTVLAAPAEQRLDRDVVVELARARAPEVLRAQAEVMRAEAALVKAGQWAQSNPTLQARGGPRLSSRGMSPDVGVTGWLPVPLLWDRWRALDAASAGISARELIVEVVRLSAVAMALDLYARVIHAQAAVALAEDRALLAQELLKTAVTRRDAGDASQLDVELAGAERYASQADVFSRKARLEDLTQQLALAVGTPTLSPNQVVGDLAALRRLSTDAGADSPELVEDLLREHPLVLAAAAEERRARAVRAHATTGWLPQVTVGAGYAYEEGAHTPSVGVRTTIPSFERGQAARAEADADVSYAQREIELTTMALSVDVARAVRLHANADAAAKTLEAESLPRANKALQLADVSYAAGKSDINALLLVRRNALSIRAESLARQLDAALAANRVELLLGVVGDGKDGSAQKGSTP